jgi:hypothetical protein
MKKALEAGAASVNIDLTDGRVVVRHGEDNTVLFEADAVDGYWDNLWKAIESKSLTKNRHRVK